MGQSLAIVLVGVGGVLLLGILIMVGKTWRQVSQGQALIVNKMGTEPKVTFTGAIVMPIFNKAEVMDLSVKTIEVSRHGKEGLICADNIRADIKVTFFVRVNKTVEDVLEVAQTIGCVRASKEETIEQLFAAKFSEALKTVGKGMEFEQLYTHRQNFKDQIKKVIGQDLNGYKLDDCAIDYLEQTAVEVLDAKNVLDALGIQKITAITSNAAVATNQLNQTRAMEIGKQDLTAKEALFRFEQAQAEAEAKKNKEVAVAQAQQENEAARFRLEEEKNTHIQRQRAEEAIQMAEQAKLRAIQVSEQGRVREVEVEKVRVQKARDLEEVNRKRDVELGTIDMSKAVETEKRAIADVIRARVAVDKTVAVEEESIKDLRADAGAKRDKQVTIVKAEAAAQELFIKDIKKAEAEQQVASATAKKQIILAEAAMDASDKEARAAIRRSEGAQAEHAAEGLAHVRVKEADALAIEKLGLAEARVRDAQVTVTEKEGGVLAENARKQGIAAAVGVKERLLAEVAAKEAEAGAIEKRMLAEAHGLAEKAEAMRAFDGTPREHEEFRMRLDAEKQIALEQLKAKVQMTEQQSRVMAEAMHNADIKIVGGDGQFFDRFVKAVSLGSSIDGVLDSSDAARRLLGDRLGSEASNGNGKRSPTELLQHLLGDLMVKADDKTKSKLKALLEQAKSLQTDDNPKVS